MDRDPAELLQEALQLPPEARAILAGSLLASLDEEVDEDAEEAWDNEIRRRLAALDAGAADLVPWSEVRRIIAGG